MGFGLWIISGLASLLLSVGFLFFPGGRIATQFNVSGQPRAFMQVGNYAWFGILLTLVTNGVVIFVLNLLSRPDGLKWANMPHKYKDCWMTTVERQNTAVRKLRDALLLDRGFYKWNFLCCPRSDLRV